MKKLFIILIIVTSFWGNSLFSQGIQIDISAGQHVSKLAFHHSKEFETDSDKKYKNFGTQYLIGISKPISRNFKLRTELGFVKTIALIMANYTYDEGMGERERIWNSWLVNEKIYLGVYPRYQYNFKNNLSVYAQCGMLVFSDVFSASINESKVFRLTTNAPFGINLGIGMVYMSAKNIGFSLDVGYSQYGKTQLYNMYHPYVGYKNINFGLGIVYDFSTPKSLSKE